MKAPRRNQLKTPYFYGVKEKRKDIPMCISTILPARGEVV